MPGTRHSWVKLLLSDFFGLTLGALAVDVKTVVGDTIAMLPGDGALPIFYHLIHEFVNAAARDA